MPQGMSGLYLLGQPSLPGLIVPTSPSILRQVLHREMCRSMVPHLADQACHLPISRLQSNLLQGQPVSSQVAPQFVRDILRFLILYRLSLFATGYVWTLPAGASITAGTNTNSILVSYSTTASPGNVTVYGTNSCSNGIPSSLPITVNLLPSVAGAISGSSTVCEGATGVVFSVPSNFQRNRIFLEPSLRGHHYSR